MTRIVKSLCLLSAVALWQGCSSSSDTSDGSTDASTNFDTAPDGPVLGLSRGMNYYKITASTSSNDGCDIGAADYAAMNIVLPANYVEATQMLSVGNQVGSPVMASLGTGVIGVTGTLTRENDASDGTCVWHQKDVSLFTLIGVDVFTLDVTETQSAFTAPCAAPAPTCMSLYKLTLTKTTAPADAGTGG